MAGFGEIAESRAEESEVVTKHKQQLIDKALGLTKNELNLAAQALATGKQTPSELDLGRLSADATAFFKTPMKVNSLVDLLKRFRVATIKEAETQNRMREEIYKIARALNNVQQEKLANWLIAKYLSALLDVSANQVNISAKKGDKAGMEAGLSVGRTTAAALAEMGIGDITRNQEEFLRKAAEGLSDPQKTDMLCAALQMGFFPTAAVFSVAGPRGRTEATPISTERDLMTQQLVRTAIATAARLNYELQRAKREFESNDNAENRERYEAAKTQLGNFLGSKASVDDLIELGSTETKIVTEAVMGHFWASYNLHTGQPSGVIPKKAPRRGMA